MRHRARRDTYLTIRVTPAERDRVHEVAARDDVPAAWLVREAIRRELRRRAEREESAR